MKKKRVYISGKITGLEIEVATALFQQAEDVIAAADTLEAVNPMKLPHNHDHSWESYMLENLAELSKCTYIFFLHNWKDSPGAKIERIWAERLEIKKLNHFNETV